MDPVKNILGKKKKNNFHGSPCPICGESTQYASGNCDKCESELQEERRELKKEGGRYGTHWW